MATTRKNSPRETGTADDSYGASPEASPKATIDTRADWRGWYAAGASFTILASALFTHLHAAWIMAVLWVIIALALVWRGTSDKSRRKFDLYVLVDVGLIVLASAAGIGVAHLLGGRLIPDLVVKSVEFGGIIALAIILTVAFAIVWLSLRGAALGSHWLVKIILAVCIFVLMVGVTQWGFAELSICSQPGAEDLYLECSPEG